ncbi:MAG TPA: lipase family protein [Kofleriaceae bacterium]
MTMRSFVVLSLALVGCGDDAQTPSDAAADAIDYSIGSHPALAIACSDSLADVYTLPSGLPTMDDSHRGDVFHCALAEKMTVPEIKAQITADNMPFMNTAEGTINSGFWTYRLAYRTTRNTVGTARAEGDTAATLIIPAKPLVGAPLVVWAHGSTGFAPKCAPSRLDLSAPVPDQDYPPMLYRLAGYGYTVIATDYAGFSYDQVPGYFNAEDEAHALLDATRAAAKLLPAPPDKVVLVGHSQGGHAVLSAQSYANAYGMQGQLIGVAALAPFWSSMSIWAASTTGIAGLKTTTDVGSILYAMAYNYSAAELRAPGTGLDVFQTAKQAAVKEVINGGECYDGPKMQALGATPGDFYLSTFVQDVGYTCAAALGTPDCTSVESTKWKARWIEDRPPIDAMSTAPILVMYGGADTFISTGRAQCARNKLAKDLSVSGATTQIQYCYNSKATHRTIIRDTDVDYLNQWIAAKAGAGPEPASCAPFPSTETCTIPPHEY